MKSVSALTVIGFLFTAQADAPAEYYFMSVHVIEHGKTANERYFLGPLPSIGDPVEMVFVGYGADGEMKFQLRAKRQSQ